MEPAVLILGLALAAFGGGALWKAGRERKKLKELSGQIEHFLLYAREPLAETLDEGSLAVLSNQLSQLEQALIRQREQFGLREEQTARFVENMAHQMKNALTALQIQLDLLSLHVSPDARTALEKSQDCMERLTVEIDRVLRSSQLAAGKIRMEFEPQQLREELALCTEKLAPLAAARRVTFQVVGAERAEVLADGFWFSQALENLLKNAAEHTEEGTAVTVTVEDRGREIKLCVEDRGPGIPPEELPELFARFHRGSVTKAGYGIGLAMAKDIIEAHHGTLTAGNRPDGGARFELSLPVLEGARSYRQA